MKHLLTLLILTTGMAVLAQPVDTLIPGTPEFYHKKSRENKAGALVMLIGGTALTTTAIAIAAPGNVNFDDLGAVVAMGGVGAALALGSIPVFNAAAKQKRRAATASILLQRVPVVKLPSRAGFLPAIGLKMDL